MEIKLTDEEILDAIEKDLDRAEEIQDELASDRETYAEPSGAMPTVTKGTDGQNLSQELFGSTTRVISVPSWIFSIPISSC